MFFSFLYYQTINFERLSVQTIFSEFTKERISYWSRANDSSMTQCCEMSTNPDPKNMVLGFLQNLSFLCTLYVFISRSAFFLSKMENLELNPVTWDKNWYLC